MSPTIHNTSTYNLFRDSKNYRKNMNTLSKNQTYTVKVHLLNASLERLYFVDYVH